MERLKRPLVVIISFMLVFLGIPLLFDNGWLTTITWIPALMIASYLESEL